MKTRFIKISFLVILLLLSVVVLTQKEKALGVYTCPDLELCPSPNGCPFPSFPPCSPTPSPCPSPSPSPCPSPSPSPPPSPSPYPSPSPSPSPSAPPSDDGDGGNGGPGEWSCGASKPPTPTLLSVTPSSSVDLAWTAVSPVSHYSIAYGLSSGDYIYGVDNTGNVTNYNVGGLDANADYCFAVRAVNDCMPSDASNEICTGQAVGGQVLGASTLAGTGDLTDEIFKILFIMGCVCLSLGLRVYLPAKKLV